MISTVTTATVTTAYSAAGIGLISILVLLALLVQKELTSTGAKNWFTALNSALNVVIVPLLMMFAFIVVMKIISILG